MFLPSGSMEHMLLVAAVQPMTGGIAPTMEPNSVFHGVIFFLKNWYTILLTNARQGVEILHWSVDTSVEQEIAGTQCNRESIREQREER